jgi:hypothetical protein
MKGTKATGVARAFHDDEGGLEAVQVVMILSFAALVLLVGWRFWGKIQTWATGKIDSFLGEAN